MSITLGLLSICPRIKKVGDLLVADTAWRLRLLTLGLLYRRVTVDPHRKELTIDRRYGWLFGRRYRLNFSSIKAVTYGYQDWAPGALLSSGHESLDQFSVGLRLRDGAEWHLFSFSGEGTFANHGPWPDWVYWDEYVFDLSGTQESESRTFVNLLSKMIRVPVVPPEP